MTHDHLTEQVLKQNSDIAAVKESVKSAHKRIDENDRITDGIHKLAANVEALALQVKLLTEKMESNIGRLESGLKDQGERIGQLEKEPAAKWKSLVSQVMSIIVAAVVGGVIANFIN
jgi:chromosome segregation ATPase